MNMKVLPGIIAIALLAATQAEAAPDVTADREIRQIIDFVAHSGCISSAMAMPMPRRLPPATCP